MDGEEDRDRKGATGATLETPRYDRMRASATIMKQSEIHARDVAGTKLRYMRIVPENASQSR